MAPPFTFTLSRSTEVLLDSEVLRGKRFIDFEQIDVLSESFVSRRPLTRRGADAHLGGLDAVTTCQATSPRPV
jgi:hypothetical protein